MKKVAIVGAGAISNAHVEGYLSFPHRCEIVAVCDIYVEKAQALVDRHQLNAVVVDDVKKLLDMQIDVVSVCTPPYTHADIAILCLNAGKHVLVEKPMAASLEECDAMLAAVKPGQILSVVAQNRFRSDWAKLKQVLDAGLAGNIVHVQVDSHWWRGHSYYDLWWRGTWQMEGGGCTLNHAVHHLDALQWMMGMPSLVQAIMTNVSHDTAEVEDVSIALLKFANGAIGQATSSVVHHGQEQQLVFQGSNARVSWPWQLYASKSKENGFPERDEVLEATVQTFYDALPDLPFEHHRGQIDNVLSALETNSPVLIDGQQGRNTLELITAIYKSAITAQPVALPLGPEDAFYRRETFLEQAPHFYEKAKSVKGFTENEITTTGGNA